MVHSPNFWVRCGKLSEKFGGATTEPSRFSLSPNWKSKASLVLHDALFHPRTTVGIASIYWTLTPSGDIKDVAASWHTFERRTCCQHMGLHFLGGARS